MFEYLIDKIEKAKFLSDPFKHLMIEDFFSDEDFCLIRSDSQIHFGTVDNNTDLRKTLKEEGYVPINFPGCTTSEDDYFSSLESNKWENIETNNNHYDKDLSKDLEGYGVTYRLDNIKNEKLSSLINFLNSREFHQCLRDKFEIHDATSIIMKFQKNLTKYEISPHTDIRQKALTMLINTNVERSTDINSEDFNTHLLSYSEEKSHVKNFWNNNQNLQRCWVPWSWCTTEKLFTKNNSFLIFSPSNDTLHAVRLNYDHLQFQRTQIYGNLMYLGGSYKNISYKDIG